MIQFHGSLSLGPDALDDIHVVIHDGNKPHDPIAAIHLGGLTVLNAHGSSPAGLVHVLRVLADRVDEAHDAWLATHTAPTEEPR